jgi:hypothetical protein
MRNTGAGAVFIGGARQTGKSTLAEAFGAQYPRAAYISFDDLSLRSAEFADPGQSFAGIEEGLIILDEIQLRGASCSTGGTGLSALTRTFTPCPFPLCGRCKPISIKKLSGNCFPDIRPITANPSWSRYQR